MILSYPVRHGDLALGSNIDEEKIPYAMDFIANYICSEDFGKVLAEEQGMFTPWKVEYDTSKLNIITQREQESPMRMA